MQINSIKHSAGSLLAMLGVLLFLGYSDATRAQTGTRSFQTSLYIDLSEPALTHADADIAMFGEGQPQPPGRSIIKLKSWDRGPIPDPVRHYDWTRIVALMIDEPYNSVKKSPCWDDGAYQAVANIDQLLAARAAELQSFAPFTRFWVNFADTQVAWMIDSTCWDIYPPDSAFLIKPYMDVISVDSYYKPFPNSNSNSIDGVQWYYDFLVPRRATASQQIALIPGTFYRSGKDSQSTQASYIPYFFTYANNANQSCNLPLPSRGVTGSFDGCLVWMVMGFPADTFVDGSEYVGELDPRANLIRQVWEGEVAQPIRRGLSIELTRQQIVSTLLTKWLSN